MILFLDTVSPLPEFSLIKKNNIIKSIQILNQKSNKISDCIIPAFLRIQLKNKIKKLVVCTGPGSFTALRVGISFMYGLSFSKKIPLIGVSCPDLLQLAIPKSNQEKTLVFVNSSNDQNFICTLSNQDKKYIIDKYDDNLPDRINEKAYNYSISNYEISQNVINTYNLQNHNVMKLNEIIRCNVKQITLLPASHIVEPIYISDNKILN